MEEVDAKLVETEIAPFLLPTARADVRAIAVQYLLGLTGSESGRQFIADNTDLLQRLISVTDDDQAAIAKDAFLAIVNLAADADIAHRIIKLSIAEKLLDRLLMAAVYEGRVEPNIACIALSNLSRSESLASVIAEFIMKEHEPDIGVKRIVDVLCRSDLEGVNYLAPFLSNLTQVPAIRKILLDHDRVVFQRILPLINYAESEVRRGGIVGTVRNCCFETEHHEWLLGDQVDLLPRLLLPLAGPEEFSDDEMDKLPVDLQYLQPDKEREPDADIRRMLVEAINQLCALKTCRRLVKDKNTYIILRELHKWEQNEANIVAIENLISVLICDEPESGLENLNEVVIPADIAAKLHSADEKSADS